MRILHIFDHSLPLQSGYVTRSLGIIRSQRARGWETIHLTTPRHPETGRSCEIFDGYEFFRTPATKARLPVVRELLEMVATRRRLAGIIRSQKPDVVHAHSPVLNVLPALSVCRRMGVPIVYEVRALWEDAAIDHGTASKGGWRYRLSRAVDTWAMRRSDSVAPICEPLRQEIVARGVSPSKVTVVPNMVDLSLAVPESLPGDSQRLRNQLKIDDQIVIGFVGSFYAYEGLDQLLVAARQLQKSRADFVVLLVGGGPEEARLKQLCLDLQVNSCVRFVSRVHHSEVFRFYHIIDILAFPRKRMRLTELVTPLKPLEAMAHSRPVLASDVGGHCELIEHGVTGFLYPADDVQALAKCLNRLLDHPEERAAVAEKGRKYVAAERTWDQLTNIYATVYDRIMAPSRRSDAKIF